MIALANETFALQNDPQQLQVNEEVMKKLEQLHPSTLSEYIDGDGPVIWVLLIPTTKDLMNLFIAGKIGETELLNKTPSGIKYEALYLCSALTLPEFRGKGLTKKLCLHAISKIRKMHPIQVLFVWSFSKEGEKLAASIALYEKLPLLERIR